ncbi:helix-turn-helix transcriptional regulator [Microbacterium sp. HJ5]
MATDQEHNRLEPTIYDVALLAGVSHMTVSRVINGGEYVRQQTSEKVLAAIRELNYSPNQAAQDLARRNPRR